MARRDRYGDDADERSKPIGSLFLHVMDRDSMPSRFRRAAQSLLVDRSLPNTPFSMYPEEPKRTKVLDLGMRGRVPSRAKDNGVLPTGDDGGSRPETVLRRRATPRAGASHFEGSVSAIRAETPVRLSRRQCRQPPGDYCSPLLRSRRACSEPRHNLLVGSLVPGKEPEKKRLIPPPMVKKPVRNGRRRASPPRIEEHERRCGVKMLQPHKHWSSAAERREALAYFGYAATLPGDVSHRNQSNWSIGGAPTERYKPIETEGSLNASRASPIQRSASANCIERPSGRAGSSTPTRREYNIISWLPQ
ncbi:hypothetical protein ERJ75_000725300 [Trypanosoma vivax]|uniref:Uncharacterized protein n=1 Tax=Trypanosoma vivax (strain Y486) TaxID=1055687 RepID=G0TX03_TRYVY|nr:hypothetical protein TRVL_07793 [Trypanosoma vivax]KAH8614158.1 hypothetical protein ERJ75_000725300 [Trypanosoma vivax]CCC48492.1 conserved hypothetical protein [Trypanosoma vivax Y486]